MASKEKNIYNALPKLPGFNFAELHEPASHGRSHNCVLSKEGVCMVLDGATSAAPREPPSGCGIPVRTILDKFPMWKTLDDKVLRFFGYYVDEVVNNSVESGVCVRKVKFHYYLADGTLAIIETPSVTNSGLRKGTTASRFKPENVDIFSFCIGGSITCRGIIYNIVDCDAATREFYDVMGMPQPEGALDYPFDNFEASKSRPRAAVDEEVIAMRRVFEAQAATTTGTHPSLLTQEEREKARNYYAHDGQVLRYFAVWEQRLFRIHYYLADGTIAVMFDPTENDGRDPNRVFIRRTRIPKDVRAALLHPETLGPRPPDPASSASFLGVEDLRPGAIVPLFTRPFLLYDCDAFTRGYVRAHYGVELPARPRPPTAAPPPPPPRPVGPREADRKRGGAGASAMVFGDPPKAANALQQTRFAQDVLRFLARVVEPAPCDRGRCFLLSYHLADDTVAVFELTGRNTGHTGGKVFARRAVDGVDDPRQLRVGHTLRLDGVEYRLEEMDQRTQRYVETGMLDRMDDAYFQLEETIATMRQYVLQQFSSSTEAYRHYASSRTNGLSAENVKEMFNDSGVRLDDALLEKIMDRVDRNHNGWVSLADFVEYLLGQKLMSDFQPRSTFAALVKEGLDPHLNAAAPKGPIQSAAALAQLSHADAAADAALRKFIAVMEARRTLLVRTFRNVAESTYDGHLGMDDVKNCLTTRLKVSLSDDELNALLYKFFYNPSMPNWAARRLSVNEVQQLIRL